jgi:predicted nucleic acid-binding protein
VATLLDTSALAVFIRRRRPSGVEELARAAREELEAGRVLVSSVTAVELLVGASSDAAVKQLSGLLDALPVVSPDRDVALLAGRMGAYARARGATIPVPDLLIAATAVWLDVSILTCDSDFLRGSRLGHTEEGVNREDDGGRLWGRLRLHPASVAC